MFWVLMKINLSPTYIEFSNFFLNARDVNKFQKNCHYMLPKPVYLFIGGSLRAIAILKFEGN